MHNNNTRNPIVRTKGKSSIINNRPNWFYSWAEKNIFLAIRYNGCSFVLRKKKVKTKKNREYEKKITKARTKTPESVAEKTRSLTVQINHQMKKKNEKGHCVHQVSGIDRPRPRTRLEGPLRNFVQKPQPSSAF